MEAYGDVTISCIVNIVSLTIGVVSPIVVWKTGFFDKVEDNKENKVSEEPNEKLGKKQPSVQYDQYDNDDLYEQEKPEKKMDTKEKTNTNSYYGTNDEDYYKENYTNYT